MKSNEYNMMNNVIKKDEYKERVNAVFQEVSEIMACTLGPYGANTTLEKSGDIVFTKDGWNVLKRISYMDSVMDTILGLLVKIALPVNLRVGDGTTTSIVGANQLLVSVNKFLEEYKHMRPKDVLDNLERIVNAICYHIQQNATQIDKDGDLEEIYHLAMVSTNEEEQVARMIQTIYKETGNPSIEFNRSKSNETTYEIVDGYKMNYMTYIDRIFITNDNNTCDIKNPLILMLDHRMEQDYYESIIEPAMSYAIQQDRRVVIVAPHYDSHLLQKFSRLLTTEFKATKTTKAVYARVSLINNNMHDLYNDFAALSGAQIISEQTAYEIIKGDLEFKPEEFIGSVENMSIGSDSTYISGFTNKNESMVEILMNDAESKYREVLQNCETNQIMSDEYVNIKQRVSKLRCKMGIINVGGQTELAKTANYHLVEDAVKACESSYLYGYVPGQNIGIQIAIDDLINSGDMSVETFDMIISIREAFTNVTKILLSNKFEKDVESFDMDLIIATCKTNQSVVDVHKTTLGDVRYSKDIINSCRTDIEILKAASSIIGLLLSSNQYITM